MVSDKKPRAVPNSNPFGLSTREIEIMIFAWKCFEEAPKINKQQLAELTKFKDADSAGRQLRKIMAHIKEAAVESTTAPGTPGTPTNGKGSGGTSATAVTAGIKSPLGIASDKKKSKKAAGGKVAGRKRTMKMGDDEDDKDEIAGGERPKKMPKHFKGNTIAALKNLEATEGGGDDVDAGEVRVNGAAWRD